MLHISENGRQLRYANVNLLEIQENYEKLGESPPQKTVMRKTIRMNNLLAHCLLLLHSKRKESSMKSLEIETQYTFSAI